MAGPRPARAEEAEAPRRGTPSRPPTRRDLEITLRTMAATFCGGFVSERVHGPRWPPRVAECPMRQNACQASCRI
eukprot:15472122-Alexandrium_andersonii.AAC.1